jgi:hypothetical protein
MEFYTHSSFYKASTIEKVTLPIRNIATCIHSVLSKIYTVKIVESTWNTSRKFNGHATSKSHLVYQKMIHINVTNSRYY